MLLVRHSCFIFLLTRMPHFPAPHFLCLSGFPPCWWPAPSSLVSPVSRYLVYLIPLPQLVCWCSGGFPHDCSACVWITHVCFPSRFASVSFPLLLFTRAAQSQLNTLFWSVLVTQLHLDLNSVWNNLYGHRCSVDSDQQTWENTSSECAGANNLNE